MASIRHFPHALMTCVLTAAALAACDTDRAADASAAIAVADGAADCGLQMRGRMEWGQEVAASGLEMQEARAEPGLVLRVWSGHDAGVTARGEGDMAILSGVARGPAWIAAEQSPGAFMLYLPEGEARLSVSAADGVRCAAS